MIFTYTHHFFPIQTPITTPNQNQHQNRLKSYSIHLFFHIQTPISTHYHIIIKPHTKTNTKIGYYTELPNYAFPIPSTPPMHTYVHTLSISLQNTFNITLIIFSRPILLCKYSRLRIFHNLKRLVSPQLLTFKILRVMAAFQGLRLVLDTKTTYDISY